MTHYACLATNKQKGNSRVSAYQDLLTIQCRLGVCMSFLSPLITKEANKTTLDM
jgi:hypothetical protein